MTLKVYVRKGRLAKCLIPGQQLWVWKVFCTQQLVEVGVAHNLMDISQMPKHCVRKSRRYNQAFSCQFHMSGDKPTQR